MTTHQNRNSIRHTKEITCGDKVLVPNDANNSTNINKGRDSLEDYHTIPNSIANETNNTNEMTEEKKRDPQKNL